MSDQVKYVLDESRLPEAWYNIAADLPEPPPPVLHPGTGQPVGPGRPRAALPDGDHPARRSRRIGSSRSRRRFARSIASGGRRRSTALAVWRRALETPARIYYKYEGVSPTGSHKPNTAVAQAYYNKQEGVTRLTTETGAGQWGSSLAFAGAIFGLEVDVWMVQGLVRPEAVPAWAHRGVRRTRRREPVRGDERGPRDPRRAPGLDRQPRHRDLRGGRGGRAARGHEVLARLGAQPRPHAPDRDRRRGADADGRGRGLPGHPHRLHRWRLELLGALVPVHRARAARGGHDPCHRGRAGRMPEPDEGHLRVRLRRHRPPHAAREDAHARLDVRPAAVPRGRPALPRHGADGEPPARARPDRGARLHADRGLRGRRPVRADRGHPPGTGGEPRREGGDRRGRPLPRGGRLAGDPLQPLRPRPLRHAGVHRLRRREARGPRVLRKRRSHSRWQAFRRLLRKPVPVALAGL